MNKQDSLFNLLEQKVSLYNRPEFISADPIQIPHLFTKKQDIEIAAFFAAIFAWGNRTTIINKSNTLMQLMDMDPHAFCLQHDKMDLKRLLNFKHRTFNDTDLLYCIAFFKHHYSTNKSLETAFSKGFHKNEPSVESALNSFYDYFFSLEFVPHRTRKHVACPNKNAACKRLNMFLRWMVRKDTTGVDFGLWDSINPSQLCIPLDLHVARVAKKLKLLNRKQTDWKAVLELTDTLKRFDPTDPVKYDFALFSMGVNEWFND